MPVALRAVLVQRADLVVVVTRVVAYPTGVSFQVETRAGSRQVAEQFDEEMHLTPRVMRRNLAERGLWLGVILADGSSAATYGGAPGRIVAHGATEEKTPPDGPLLSEHGGGGGGGSWEWRYWLWPLPPPGELTFVCEWPGLSIPETRLTVDVTPVCDAAKQAIVLWEPFRGY